MSKTALLHIKYSYRSNKSLPVAKIKLFDSHNYKNIADGI